MADSASSVVVVTGGTTGIGFATAEAFLQQGAEVVITGVNAGRLQSAVKQLGPNCHGIIADNAVPRETAQIADYCRTRFGRIDVLIANAGICLTSRIGNLTEADFEREMDTNFKGTFFLIQHCLPLMPQGSTIALTTSGNDRKGIPGQLVYSASKAALRSMIRTLAAELAPRGIRVNGVAPGPIDTPVFDKASSDPAAAAQMRADEAGMPVLKRLGRPAEIADAFVFLAGRNSSYITGADIPVDGGWVDI